MISLDVAYSSTAGSNYATHAVPQATHPGQRRAMFPDAGKQAPPPIFCVDSTTGSRRARFALARSFSSSRWDSACVRRCRGDSLRYEKVAVRQIRVALEAPACCAPAT